MSTLDRLRELLAAHDKAEGPGGEHWYGHEKTLDAMEALLEAAPLLLAEIEAARAYRDSIQNPVSQITSVGACGKAYDAARAALDAAGEKDGGA